MQLNVQLTGKLRLLLAGLVLLLVLGALWFFFSGRGPSPEEQRLAHLDFLVMALEAYRNQYGFYPQPAAREETAEGFRHVWGYRPELPALASCVVVSEKDGTPDPLRSVCGGNIYDTQGRVVGWKGTLTPRSGQNNVEVVMKGTVRIAAPFSEIARNVPLDPAYAPHANLAKLGLGEYVYAVRVPGDGAQGKGGVEYQLAATLRDPTTGRLRTIIRGNYFVLSADREVMPPSLIGPGLILDRFGNPLPDQEQPLHVLLDGQQEGYPNPLLGEGEKVLRFHTLRIRAKRLLQAVTSREELVHAFPSSKATEVLQGTLATIRGTLEPLVQELQNVGRTAGSDGAGELDLDALEADVQELSQQLANATTAFLAAKAEEVRVALRAEAEQRRAVVQIVSGAFLTAQQAQEFVLLARDEVIKYLDGEGIEDQSRSRAARKIASALEDVPDLPALFSEAQLPSPHLFLSPEVQEKLYDLGNMEEGRQTRPAPTQSTGSLLSDERTDAAATGVTIPAEHARTGTGGTEGGLPSSSVMVTTLTSEFVQLFAELKDILASIRADLESPASPVVGIDDALRRLARALTTELERLEAMFARLATEDVAQRFLAKYESLLTAGNPVEAMRVAAEFAELRGDFSSFPFSPGLLEAVVFEKKPGIPDIFAYEHPLEAEYKGIPYPLP